MFQYVTHWDMPGNAKVIEEMTKEPKGCMTLKHHGCNGQVKMLQILYMLTIPLSVGSQPVLFLSVHECMQAGTRSCCTY